MPTERVYGQIYQLLQAHIGPALTEASLERVALLVTGIVGARSASPARVAKTLHSLGLSEATAESIERRVRRIENDTTITSAICLHPLARSRLLFGRPKELLLVVDPTSQDERVVMVSVAVWYRGRALPLAWATWPANCPLEGEGFWQRLETLLSEVAPLIPATASVTCLADRAFGTPAFIDLVLAKGWHYVVRVQDQSRCRDRLGRECKVRELVRFRGQRKKLSGQVFKGWHWRNASVLVYWGRRHKGPLCLVSDWPPRWSLMALYRRRYGIEASFRDYKSLGWRWEQGQVRALAHLERLLVGMAIATWVTLAAGSQVAMELLACKATGKRRTRPYVGKQSLFGLGLERLAAMLHGVLTTQLTWEFALGETRNWSQQISDHHTHAYVWA